MSKFVGIVVGGLAIAGAVAFAVVTGGAGIPLAVTIAHSVILSALVTAGTGAVLSGLGTLLTSAVGGSGSGSVGAGVAIASRNPIAAQVIPYGRTIVGGSIVHLNEFGDENKYLDVVIVLAARPCEAVDTLLFDGQPVQLSTDGGTFTGVGGSFTPVQQTVSIAHITRTKDVVKVEMGDAIPLLMPGDKVVIQDVSGDFTLNGTFPVESVSTDHKTFTYINGGNAGAGIDGSVKTTWPDYGHKVHMEVLLGDHTDTFPGMLLGTGDDNDSTTDHSIVCPNNPWTADHKLLGKCCVFLRLHYNDTYFTGGLPQISFLIRGAKDIYDPRLGVYGAPATTAYTENAALAIADYISNTAYGFKAAYGTEIPLSPLIAAANICDEDVALAIGGFEPRYALNGKFDLSLKRGEVLQNLLTACAGRLTYSGGQFVVWPAAWNGSSPAPAPGMGGMAGPFRWKGLSIRDLYNGVKGTYVCPANNWQASDIPPYAQDSTHGYATGPVWSGGAAYVIGNIVQYSGVGYIALAAGTGHQPDTSPSYWATTYQDANLTADGGDRRWLDIQLPFTISAATAQRICKIELLRRRHSVTATFRYNLSGYSMTAMDVVSMTVPFLNWDGNLVEILAHRFTLDKQSDGNGNEVTLLGTEIDVQETDAGVYDWLDSEELTPQGYQQPAVPDARAPKPPTGLTLESDESTVVVTPQGIADAILVSWDAPLDGYVLNGGHMEIQYELIENYTAGTLSATNGSKAIVGTGTAWTSDMDGETVTINGPSYAIGTVTDSTHMTLFSNFLGATASGLLYSIAFSSAWMGLPSVNPSVTQVVINGVIDGAQYNVQIRSVNAGGTSSPWVVAGPVRATGANAPFSWKPFAESDYMGLRPAGYAFAMAQDSIAGATADQPGMYVKGWPPVNVFSTAITAAPVIDPYAVVSASTGASTPLGDWVALVFSIDSGGMYSRASNPVTFNIDDIAEKATFTAELATGTAKYQVFVGHTLNTLIGQAIHTHAPGALSIVLQSFSVTGYGPPDPNFDHFHIRAKREIHAGVFAANVESVSSGIFIKIGLPSGGSLTLSQFDGYIISNVSRYGLPSSGPYPDAAIVHTATDGTFTVGSNSGFDVGDLILIRAKADTYSANTIGCSNFENVFYPTGMDTNDESDYEVALIAGTGAGQVRDIASNSSTVLTIKDSFAVIPDATTLFVVREKGWQVDVKTTPLQALTYPTSAAPGPTIANIVISSLQGFVAWVEVTPADVYGNDAPFSLDQFREIYVLPSPEGNGGITIDGVQVAY